VPPAPDGSVEVMFPPMPMPDPLTAFFWEGVNRHRLLILRCQACGHHVHYPRPICDRCQSTDLVPEEISGRATVYSYAVVMQAFHPYFADKLPYVVAVVEADEEPGLRLTTNIIECQEADLAVGMPVRVEFREVAPSLTLPLFRPA